MGKSVTINCIGEGVRKDGKAHLYLAMNKMDILRQRLYAKKNGDKIQLWYAQTRTGEKILGLNSSTPELLKDDNFVNIKIKTITCPKCKGTGCGICDGSGIMTKKLLGSYQPWQLKPDTNPTKEAQ